MIAAIAIIATITVVLAIVVPWFLKAEVDTTRETERHIFDPRTPTVAYRMPAGVDIAVIAGAVAAAGHAQAVGSVGGHECLVVECRPGERELIRALIDDAARERYGRAGLRIGAVAFTDETV